MGLGSAEDVPNFLAGMGRHGSVPAADEYHGGAEAQAALRRSLAGAQHAQKALPCALAQQGCAHAVDDIVVHGISGVMLDHPAEIFLYLHRLPEPSSRRRGLGIKGCGEQGRDMHLRLHAVGIERGHFHHGGTGAAVTGEVPHGGGRAALAVDFVQNTPEDVGAGHAVLGNIHATVAAAEARQVNDGHEAAQLHKLRNDLAPVKAADQRGGEQHDPLPGRIHGRGNTEMHADSVEGQVLAFVGHCGTHLPSVLIYIQSILTHIHM